MSKAAQVFSGRGSFVNRNRLGLDSVVLFASTNVASRAFPRALIPVKRIAERDSGGWRNSNR
jgi:hypothetical protein